MYDFSEIDELAETLDRDLDATEARAIVAALIPGESYAVRQALAEALEARA